MQTALPTLPALDELTAQAAQRWVAAAIARETALRTHDDQLFPGSDDPVGLDRATQLRDAWSAWASEAEQILAHIGSHTPVEHCEELVRRLGRARAMLRLSPQMLNKRRAQVAGGQVRTVEEVRSELRLKDRG